MVLKHGLVYKRQFRTQQPLLNYSYSPSVRKVRINASRDIPLPLPAPRRLVTLT